MPSRMNMSCITEPCPPVPAAIMHAAASSTTIAPTWVTMRRRSSRNRSSISSANAPSTTSSSGASGAMSASVRTCGVMSVITACIPSKLACGKLRRQLCDGGLHQVGQRLRPDADQQHDSREYAEPKIGRTSCWGRRCPHVYIQVVAVSIQTNTYDNKENDHPYIHCIK